MAVSANRLELLQIADAVAREKAIDRGIVIAAMEDAIAKAARSRYGAETDVHAEIEPKTGDLRLTRHMLVVEAVENPSNQITLEGARKHHPAAQVGDTIADPLPPLEYGRIAAQSAKQVIVQKVREAERDRQYQEFKDRIGDIVNGIVKRVEYGNVIVDLGRGEGIIRRDEALPRETPRQGDRIRAYVYDVRREQRGPQYRPSAILRLDGRSPACGRRGRHPGGRARRPFGADRGGLPLDEARGRNPRPISPDPGRQMAQAVRRGRGTSRDCLTCRVRGGPLRCAGGRRGCRGVARRD